MQLRGSERLSTAPSNLCRAVLREAAEKYIDPSFDMDKPPRIMDLAHSYGLDLGEDEVAHDKVERYALATAAIHFMMQGAVVGESAQTTFADAETVPESGSPLFDLQAATQASFARSSQDAALKNEELAYALDRYEALSEEDPHAAILEGDELKMGGNLPGDGASLVGAAVSALAARTDICPVDLEECIAISHTLLPAATGRATKHLDIFSSDGFPSWPEELENGIILAKRGSQFALTRRSGRPLFSVPHSLVADVPLVGPLLKCPAHQRLQGRRHTALEQGLHAVVNLAAARGVYEHIYGQVALL